MPPPRPATAAPQRLLSLDVFRGFLLLALASAGLGTAQLLAAPQWTGIALQLRVSDWQGCTLWDLIQPCFLFVVGIAMSFSHANRQARGFAREFLHALLRTFVLLGVGIFLDAYEVGRFRLSSISLTGPLQQIALAYFFAFLLLPLGVKVQAVAVVFLLGAHTAAFFIHGKAMGIDPWLPGQNVGTFLDRLLGLPVSPEHYATFNVVSATATVLLGLLCAEVLRGPLAPGRKVAVMLGAGLTLLAIGWALSGGNGWLPFTFPTFVPMVKRLATASFTLYAAGWAFLIMAAFYLIIDVMQVTFWSYPLVVVGVNSLLLVVFVAMLRPVVRRSIQLFMEEPQTTFPAYRPILLALVEMLVYWLLCFWLYRNKMIVKV